MIRSHSLSASLTGVFCSGFAMVFDYATDMLRQGQIVIFSFISGLLGSIAAQTAMRKAGGGAS